MNLRFKFFLKNSKKPYFIGHERDDVVKSREKLVDFFIKNKHRFYQQTGEDDPQWVEPTEDDPFILITHDECTAISGEQQSKKWGFEFNAPFLGIFRFFELKIFGLKY